MTPYPIALYLHILGALGLFIAIGFEWLGVTRLRGARTRDEVVTWIRVVSLPRVIAPASLVVILVAGLYMAAAQWGFSTWPGAAIVGIVVLAVLGAVLTGATMRGLGQALGAEQGPLSPSFVALLARPRPVVSLWLRTGLALGILWLMVFKPDLLTSYVVLIVGTVLGLIVGYGLAQRPAPAAAVR